MEERRTPDPPVTGQEPGGDLRIGIIGAGIYGLSAALACRDLGDELGKKLDVLIYEKSSEVASAWTRMPPLPIRSNVGNSSIMLPGLTLIDFYRDLPPERRPSDFSEGDSFHSARIPLQDIHEYANWITEKRGLNPNLNTEVRDVQPIDRRYQLELQRADQIWQEEVDCLVLAIGLAGRASVPNEFSELWKESLEYGDLRVCHTAQQIDYSSIKGSVLVIGAGQSGGEAVWLALEAGSQVIQYAREGVQYNLHPLPNSVWENYSNPIMQRFLRMMWKGVPPNLDQMPFASMRIKLSNAVYSAMTKPNSTPEYAPKPGQAYRVIDGRRRIQIQSAGKDDDGLGIVVQFSDGTEHYFDHVILATGYGPVILNPLIRSMLNRGLLQVDPNHPSSILSDQYGRSIVDPGILIIGSPAGRSLGPFYEFIRGTNVMRERLQEAIRILLAEGRKN